MPDNISLNASTRTVLGKKVKTLRNQGMVPGVIYGPEFDSLPVAVDARELRTTLIEAGGTNVIDIQLEKDTIPVLVRDVQRDRIRDNVIHIDFYRIAMDRLLRTEVPITIVGEPEIIATGEAVYLQLLNSLEVETLPGNLVDEIEVDITDLKVVGDQYLVEDLKLPEGFEAITSGEDLVVKIDYAQQEVEEEPAEDDLLLGTSPSEPEVIRERPEDEE